MLRLSLRSFPNSSLPLPRFSNIRRTGIVPLKARNAEMEGGADDKSSPSSGAIAHTVNKIRQFVNNDPTDGWDKCWEQALTPWDLGKPTPVILHLLETGSLPKGRILVPGCGSGHDVVAIAGPERYVVGLDVSENANKKAREMFSSSQKASHYDFIKEDFFTWNSPSLFDLIFDYTFFCAIEPSMRPAWARQVSSLLKPDGELITLMFPIDDHIGGPPYKVSLADYEEVLHPLGFVAVTVMDNELAIDARKGKEKLGRWKKPLKESHL